MAVLPCDTVAGSQRRAAPRPAAPLGLPGQVRTLSDDATRQRTGTGTPDAPDYAAKPGASSRLPGLRARGPLAGAALGDGQGRVQTAGDSHPSGRIHALLPALGLLTAAGKSGRQPARFSALLSVQRRPDAVTLATVARAPHSLRFTHSCVPSNIKHGRWCHPEALRAPPARRGHARCSHHGGRRWPLDLLPWPVRAGSEEPLAAWANWGVPRRHCGADAKLACYSVEFPSRRPRGVGTGRRDGPDTPEQDCALPGARACSPRSHALRCVNKCSRGARGEPSAPSERPCRSLRILSGRSPAPARPPLHALHLRSTH